MFTVNKNEPECSYTCNTVQYFFRKKDCSRTIVLFKHNLMLITVMIKPSFIEKNLELDTKLVDIMKEDYAGF